MKGDKKMQKENKVLTLVSFCVLVASFYGYGWIISKFGRPYEVWILLAIGILTIRAFWPDVSIQEVGPHRLEFGGLLFWFLFAPIWLSLLGVLKFCGWWDPNVVGKVVRR